MPRHGIRKNQSFYWTLHGNSVALRSRSRAYVSPLENILYFQAVDWQSGLLTPQQKTLVPFFMPQSSNTVPIYAISDFKGLEADAVILLMRGKVLNHRQALYVGISRARASLSIIDDEVAAGDLPRGFKWDAQDCY